MSELTSNLISGKDALIAILSGEKIQYVPSSRSDGNWSDIGSVESFDIDEWISEKSNANPVTFKFRLKPKTIMLNGVEIPAPFKPVGGEVFWHIFPTVTQGYGWCEYEEGDSFNQFGTWRTEDEIKQVVAALRNVFGGNK